MGHLYHVQSYPYFDTSLDQFVELNTRTELLAINRDSQYIEFEAVDLIRCEQLQHILLCGSQDDLWVDRSEKECVPSLFFDEQEEAAALCDFKSFPVGSDPPKPIKLDSSSYHYALSSQTVLSMQCGVRPTEVTHLKGDNNNN